VGRALQSGNDMMSPQSSPRQTLSYLRDLMASRSIHPKNKLGQNFLIDLNLLDVMVRAAELSRLDLVLEVGSGTGGLTNRLAEHAGAVLSVEIDALADSNAAAAYRAVWRLADRGDPAVRYLEERLQPVVEADGQRWRKLLDQLDSNRPAEREAASRELAKLGYQIEMTLVRTAEQTGLAEVRRRVRALLEALPRESSPEALQQSRALQVLELLGTTEARRLLKILAQGAAEARLTQEARSSLQRLAKRPAAPP
jgi:hypothetical protein